MFDDWGPWAWVAAAWLELAFAYGGYLIYLRWREHRVRSEEDEA